MGEVSNHLKDSQPTKRHVMGITAKFFDPLGVVSPVTVMFKMFFQTLCENKLGWDEPLTGDLLLEWNKLKSTLHVIAIPRCYTEGTMNKSQLIGFCDASAKAYAAVVYLRVESDRGSVEY